MSQATRKWDLCVVLGTRLNLQLIHSLNDMIIPRDGHDPHCPCKHIRRNSSSSFVLNYFASLSFAKYFPIITYKDYFVNFMQTNNAVA